ncbi:MAG: phosphate/phosphite/phosphonate ABC transporter substrate-binding protein [Burkholderiales bacterium]
MDRRRHLASIAALAAGAIAPATSRAAEPGPLRIGLTPVFLDNQITLLNAWRGYLQDALDGPVQFVQRGTYREIVDALRGGGLDFGWICGYPYVRHASELGLVAVPLYAGAPLYRSYLIVPESDTRARSILDLRGGVFAYSDPDSNSGYLYPTYALVRLQERPDAFFRRTFFTWAHRSVVDAVAAGLADGGAVDGYVWETLARTDSTGARRTRVIARSQPFGFPPFVGHARLPKAKIERLRAALIGMGRDERGRRLLAQLNLDGFTAGETALFDGIRQMVAATRGVAGAAVS